jgi:hypothetical protein
MDKLTDNDIYQKAPKSPNFLLIVILFGATILICFGLAYLFLTDAGKKLWHRPPPNPNAMVWHVEDVNRV